MADKWTGPSVSAKVLGQLSMEDFCERCFWIQLHAKKPWSIFPGIFSAIDIYTKNATNIHHDASGKLPVWLEQAWPGGVPMAVPHWSKFSINTPKHGVRLRGSPDEILKMPDDTLAILDYKTAKISKNYDVLAPMYETQINAYAYLAEGLDWGKVSSLALVYNEPQRDFEAIDVDAFVSAEGFKMPFVAAIKPVGLNLDSIEPLLKKVAEIHEMVKPPAGSGECKDCAKLDDIIEKLK